MATQAFSDHPPPVGLIFLPEQASQPVSQVIWLVNVLIAL